MFVKMFRKFAPDLPVSVFWFLLSQAAIGLTFGSVVTATTIVAVELEGLAFASRILGVKFTISAVAGFTVGSVISRFGYILPTRTALCLSSAACLPVASGSLYGVGFSALLMSLGYAYTRPSVKLEMWQRAKSPQGLMLGMIANMSGFTLGAVFAATSFTYGFFPQTMVLSAFMPLLTLNSFQQVFALSKPPKVPFYDISAFRPVLKFSALLSVTGGLMQLQAPYVVDFFGAFWAGPLEVSHVVGQILTVFVFRSLFAHVSLGWMVVFLMFSLSVTPYGVVFALTGRILASMAGHFVQSKVEARVLSSKAPADQIAKLSAVSMLMIGFVVQIAAALVSLTSYSFLLFSTAFLFLTAQLFLQNSKRFPASS